MNKTEYLILGGGISGLSFASHKKNNEYIVLEAQEQCGGLCRSFYDSGFVWDVAGHFFHFHKEETKDYFLRLMNGKPLKYIKKTAKVYYKGKYLDAPFQYNIHQLPEKEFIECLTELYYADGGDKEETFEGYVRAKYGRGIADKFLIPYNTKLYTCHMNELEKDSMGEFLPKLDFSTLMSFYRGNNGVTYNDYFIYPENGCYEVISALLALLDENRIHTNERVMRIDEENKTVMTSSDSYQYEYLINTIPLNTFADLIGEKNPPFNYNKVLVLNLGFDMPSIDPEVHWSYFPGDEVFYRVGFYNNIVGKEKLSIYVEIGYKANEKIDTKYAMDTSLADLKRVGIIDKHRLTASQTVIIDPGYAHITHGGKMYIDDLCARMAEKHVYMVGRYANWQYLAMDDSIEQASELALKI